jgi:putative transcriptional regulator
MIQPAAGVLLIADPFLKDPNFMRTVVFLCEHEKNGTLGFVLNRKYEDTIDELITDLEGFPIPVYYGGPVMMNTIHFLHQFPTLIPDSIKVAEDVYWGGNFETVSALIKSNSIDLSGIKFFIGYSGWATDQLDGEIEAKSWLTVDSTRALVFDTGYDEVWKASLKHLGGDYQMLVNYPIDPQLN